MAISDENEPNLKVKHCFLLKNSDLQDNMTMYGNIKAILGLCGYFALNLNVY